MATSSGKPGEKKKLGKWKIKRSGERELLVTLPEGMQIKGDGPINIEELLIGIANYMAAKQGVIPECCTTNLMVA